MLWSSNNETSDLSLESQNENPIALVLDSDNNLPRLHKQISLCQIAPALCSWTQAVWKRRWLSPPLRIVLTLRGCNNPCRPPLGVRFDRASAGSCAPS